MENKEQYVNLLSEIIAKQAIILGPDIAVLKARTISGLQVADDGKVTDFSGDATTVIQKLVDAYVDLSGQIVKNALGSVFARYPDIKT
ncbi:MAG: hypothetical protein V1719_02560 [Patescibacteria group bacterium]